MLRGFTPAFRRCIHLQWKPKSVCRTANDRLAMEIEAGVEDPAYARYLFELAQQSMVSRVPLAGYNLRPARQVERMKAAGQIALGHCGGAECLDHVRGRNPAR